MFVRVGEVIIPGLDYKGSSPQDKGGPDIPDVPRRGRMQLASTAIFLVFGILALACMLSGGLSTPAGASAALLILAMGVFTAFVFGLKGVLVEIVLLSALQLVFLAEAGLAPGALNPAQVVTPAVLVLVFSLASIGTALCAGYQVRAAELASHKENMLRKIFHTLPIGIWVCARDGRTVYVNDRWASFSGRRPAEILREGSPDPPVDLGPDWAERAATILDGGESAVYYESIDLVDDEGRESNLTLLTTRVFIDHLGDFGTLSLLVDETSTRLHEKRIRTTERRLRLALNNAVIGFWDEDLVNRKVFADENWYRILEADDSEAASPMETWKARLHPDDRKRVLDAYETFMGSSGEKSLRIDYRIRKGRDEFIWVQDRVSVTEWRPDGRPARIMGTLHDISERKRDAIDLKLAKDRAEAANEAKGYFLATISHEIRTPLNAIIGLSSFLSESRLDEEQRDLAQTIYTSGKSLLLLVNDILDFSKIESGRLELETQEYPLRLCFEDSLKLFSTRAAEKNVELRLDLDPDLPEFALGDMERLRQIVNNLVANALKFTEAGEVEISARRVEPEELPRERRPDPLEPVGFLDQADHDYLEVRVRDTGVGIPREKQHLLFEAFSQADPSTTRKYGGTGLGLAICKRLVQAMGGCIWTESEAGEGAVFGFVIRTKLIRGDAELGRSTRSPFNSEERIAEQYPCDILVVGPPRSTDALLLSCRRLGYAPHHFTDYDIEANAFGGRFYDLVFISVEEEAPALALARNIRKNAAGKWANTIVGLLPEGNGKAGPSEERCKLSGMELVLATRPSRSVVRELIMDVLLARG